MSIDERQVTEPAAKPGSRRRWVPPRTLKTLAVPTIAFLVWVGLTEFTDIRNVFLPSPFRIAEVFWAIKAELLSAFFISMQMILGGLFIGGTLGITAGLLFGISRQARDYFEFPVDLIRPIPLFALIPLFILWFGIGKRPQIALVSLGVFLLLSIVTIEAIRNVPPIYVRAALTLGASRTDVYKTIVVRAISPHLIAGIRLAGAYSFGLDCRSRIQRFTGGPRVHHDPPHLLPRHSRSGADSDDLRRPRHRIRPDHQGGFQPCHPLDPSHGRQWHSE